MTDRACNYSDLKPHIKAFTDLAGLSMDDVYEIVIEPFAITVKHYLLNERGHKYIIRDDPEDPDSADVARGEISIALVREAK